THNHSHPTLTQKINAPTDRTKKKEQSAIKNQHQTPIQTKHKKQPEHYQINQAKSISNQQTSQQRNISQLEQKRKITRKTN
ncbi:hypothetical protein Q6275_29055, partial [Klebsiella pneumoniae]